MLRTKAKDDLWIGTDLGLPGITGKVNVRLEGEKGTHVHGNPFDLNAQTYSLSAAAKAEAKIAAERTRNKLLNFASALAGEYDEAVDCVVSLGGAGEQDHPHDGQHQGGQEKHDQQADSESADDLFSDWA